MAPPERAERLTIYLLQTQHHGSVADFVEIVARARKAGMEGATVLHGREGFGASSSVHRRHLSSVSEDMPVTVTIVDSPEKIDLFLDQIADLVGDATTTRTAVTLLSRPIGSDQRLRR